MISIISEHVVLNASSKSSTAAHGARSTGSGYSVMVISVPSKESGFLPPGCRAWSCVVVGRRGADRTRSRVVVGRRNADRSAHAF